MTSTSSTPLQTALHAVNAVLVGFLCATLAAPSALVAMPEHPGGDVPVVRQAAPLTPEQKVEHALNRFTFGPRPGDEAAVSRMGLEAWFQQQLHPERIDDSAFQAELAKFPALGLSQEQLIRRFPSPQMVRRAGAPNQGLRGPFAQNAVDVPSDPVEHAIYADAVYAYSVGPKGQAKAAAKQGASGAGATAGGEDTMSDAVSAMQPGMQAAGAQPAGARAPGAKTAGVDAAQGGQGEMAASAGEQEMNPAAAAKGKGKGKKQALDAAAAPMSRDEVEAVLALAPDARMDRLVGMTPPEMLSFRSGLKPFERLALVKGLSPAQTETVAALTTQPIRVVGAEALEGRLLRDVDSDRQLQAVMTDFWLNHFSVYAKKNQNEPYFLNSYERDTILPNALGKFENLLVATAESPAMMMYLDNWQSVGPDSPAAQRGKRVQQFADANPQRKGVGLLAQVMPKGINENYARELMELHTLGVRCEVSSEHPKPADPSCGNGYTQADVTSVAKVLTGWTIDRPYQGGRMVFDENKHEGGTKTVLGETIKESGDKEGLEVLHMLATSPATAHFISEKLAVRFVSDTPPDALVNRMADTFLKTQGDIKAVLTTLFRSPEFWSPEVYRAKIKTPIEFVASALRASNATVNNALPLVQAMDRLGMPIYGMQTPNGYSWAHDEWVSSNALISRMNFALVLSGDLLPGTRTDWPGLLGSDTSVSEAPTEQDERRLEALLLGQPAAERTRATVLAESKNPSAQRAAAQSFAAGKAQDAELAEDSAGVPLTRVGGKRRGQGGGANPQATGDEAPLDTMAGLLLGSPDFQRR